MRSRKKSYTFKRMEALGSSEVRKSSSYDNADAVGTSAGDAKSKSGQRLGRRRTFLFQMMSSRGVLFLITESQSYSTRAMLEHGPQDPGDKPGCRDSDMPWHGSNLPKVAAPEWSWARS